MTAQGNEENTELRMERRLLRFLEKGEARLRPAAAASQLLVEGDGRGTIGVSEAALSKLRTRGVVVVRKDVITLGSAEALDMVRCDDPLLAPKRQIEDVPVETDFGIERVAVNMAESPLALLWRHKGRTGERFLTLAEFRAGERLRADYSRGQIMARMGVNWMAAGGSGRRRGDANGIAELTDAALSARRRVERAVDAVGPELAGVLIDVCCFLKGLERVETERGWPVRSAKVVLKSALSALARHYEPQRHAPERRVLHWGAEDYRPSLR